MVGSGTRKARAISFVVMPASVRRVSATCASNDRAGWQQVNIKRSRSSGTSSSGASSSSPVAMTATSRVLDAPIRARRTRSTARWRATVVSQAPGRRGMPSRGQRSSALAKASCAHSSARSQSPVSRTMVATTRPHSAWNASATAASTSGVTSPRSASLRYCRRGRRGSSQPPRWPRRGPCSRRGSSRRAAPWSRRRGRRS